MVYFEDFWQELLDMLETPKSLKTLAHHKLFKAHCYDSEIIITTNKQGIVKIDEDTFLRFWEMVKIYPREERFVDKNHRLSVWFKSTSYMSALMDEIMKDRNPQ